VSGLPWIADFRDPMAQDDYPPDPAVWRSYKEIEEHVVHNATRSVFVTPGAVEMYRSRYPKVDPNRMVLIENGYDDRSFDTLGERAASAGPLNTGKITLVHSGIVYPADRDPRHFLAALKRLRAAGKISAERLAVRFRAAVHEQFVTELVREAQLQDVVEVAPPIGYREALLEMMRADGLLVLQASTCNSQVPAKIYEYLRARRPVLALTDPVGDTAKVLTESGVADLAPLDDVSAIERTVERFLETLRRGGAALPAEAYVAGASRLARSKALVQLLDEVCAA
jgi:hypothetical protein